MKAKIESIREMDKLGVIIIPEEIRESIGITSAIPLRMYADSERGQIIIQKWWPNGEEYGKTIRIKEVVMNDLSVKPADGDEYNATCDIDFMLSKPYEFDVLGKNYTVDRIKMTYLWGGLSLALASENLVFNALEVPKNYIYAVFQSVAKEQEGDHFRGWCFEDDLLKLLRK